MRIAATYRPASTAILIILNVRAAAASVTGSAINEGQRQVGSAVLAINSDFPDPDVMHNGQQWFAFATSGNGKLVQTATSTDLATWSLAGDALSGIAAWVNADDPAVWAPHVRRLADNKFVLYYSAATKQNPSLHCIGAATSDKPEGPYTPTGTTALVCPLASGGAIDPSTILDSGKLYLVWKVDGNAINLRDSQGNPSSPIMLQELSQSDGLSLLGTATAIFDVVADEGNLVEAPFISKTAAGGYTLLYSTGPYDSSTYNSKYATSSKLTGPYTRRGVLLDSATTSLSGPGGACLTPDSSKIVFHAIIQQNPLKRAIYTAQVFQY